MTGLVGRTASCLQKTWAPNYGRYDLVTVHGEVIHVGVVNNALHVWLLSQEGKIVEAASHLVHVHPPVTEGPYR
jgi:hypothetical protein